MSTYQDMWNKIRSMSRSDREDWIRLLTPARGLGVDFLGVNVNDVDLLEALKNSLED